MKKSNGMWFFFLKYVFTSFSYIVAHTVTSLVVLNTIPREKLLQSKRMRKAKVSKAVPGACHLAMPQGGLLVTLAVFDLLLPLQNWGMHSTETHNMPGMSPLAELRNHWVLCVAIQAFSARTFLQTCHTLAMLMSQQELSKKLQRAQKLRVYCLVQIFLRNCWQCYFRIRICCSRRSNLSDKYK